MPKMILQLPCIALAGALLALMMPPAGSLSPGGLMPSDSLPPAGFPTGQPLYSQAPAHFTPGFEINIAAADDWAHPFIREATRIGLVPPHLQMLYDMPITRMEFAQMAVLLIETVQGRVIPGRAHFPDTEDECIQKIGYLGIAQGMADGSFEPHTVMSRQQVAVMLARIAYVLEIPLAAPATAFADAHLIGLWAAFAVGQVMASGMMTAEVADLFDPHGAYTRQMSIVTMLRMYNHSGGTR